MIISFTTKQKTILMISTTQRHQKTIQLPNPNTLYQKIEKLVKLAKVFQTLVRHITTFLINKGGMANRTIS